MADQRLLSGVRELTIADAIYWFDVAIVLAPMLLVLVAVIVLPEMIMALPRLLMPRFV